MTEEKSTRTYTNRTRIAVNGYKLWCTNIECLIMTISRSYCIFFFLSFLVPMSNRTNNNSWSVCICEHCAYDNCFMGSFFLLLSRFSCIGHTHIYLVTHFATHTEKMNRHEVKTIKQTGTHYTQSEKYTRENEWKWVEKYKREKMAIRRRWITSTL